MCVQKTTHSLKIDNCFTQTCRGVAFEEVVTSETVKFQCATFFPNAFHSAVEYQDEF